MGRLGRVGFLGIAVVFHLIYLYSICDIYFVSPIVHGMRQHRVDAKPPAKRLFLIVGDGLRADKCFQSHVDPDTGEKAYLAPFIRSRVLNEGSFGVSHTRVPTESRPGHVALIAGLYEDVSAVMTGWKLNPVNFDSVFNQSRHTWSWGSPDILPMFAKGASDPNRVDAYTYGEEFEDFTQDSTLLDTWVFDRVERLFKEAAKNSTLKEMLHKDKIVFFLHLLGLDTSGHAYRPYSPEYLRNIKVVDEGVARISNIVDSFYNNDGESAWVFTADHGMSDWGSHGDGHPDNTRTPLVAWGSGVKKPVKVKSGEKALGHEDGFSSDWGLDQVRRVDVEQADVAALMAYLVGLNFPVNSVGKLPLEYLNAANKVKAKAAFTNALEILEQYRVKEEQKRSHSLHFKPYPPLDPATSHSLETRSLEIAAYIDSENYELAIEKSLDLIKYGLGGLRYLQTYDWLLLRTTITIGYLGWIAYALTTVIRLHVLRISSPRSSSILSPWSSFLFWNSFRVFLFSILYVQESRLTYYLYFFFPTIFWEEVISQRNVLIRGGKLLFKEYGKGGFAKYLEIFLKGVGVLAFLEAMVYSYFHRGIFTALFLLGSVWPLFYGITFIKQNASTITLWAVCCSVMSVFTLLPVVKIEDEKLILLGGALMFIFGLAYMIVGNNLIDPSYSAGLSTEKGALVGKTQDDKSTFSKCILGIQVGLILLSMIVTSSSVRSLQAKQGLPLGNQAVGWLVMVLSMIVPFLHYFQPGQAHYCHRLMVIYLSFAPTFVILTISYEGLFYVLFCITLVLWVRLEHLVYLHENRPEKIQAKRSQSKTSLSSSLHTSGASRTISPAFRTNHDKEGQWRPLTLSSLRISLFFFFLIQSAFFSTGNIASISSFSLDSVYRLIPVFQPFAMTALLLFKLLVPFALISLNLGILNRKIQLQQSAIFMVVMAISDVLTLNFFYMVKDEGSWLEIGSTISHYCIGGLLFVFVAGLELLSEGMVGGLIFDEGEKMGKQNSQELVAVDGDGKGDSERKGIEEGEELRN